MKILKSSFIFSNLLYLTFHLFIIHSCRGQERKETGDCTKAACDDTLIILQATNTNGTGEKANLYVQKEVKIQRSPFGKTINLNLNPAHEGGLYYNTIWEEEYKVGQRNYMRRVIQLSSTVISYQNLPENVVPERFYYYDQPMKLEFLDSAYRSIKTVDIWNNRPYKNIPPNKLSYWNFDGENTEVIPYKEQKTRIIPNEYSLFTNVLSEGTHVVVNYELRGLKNNQVVNVKHTLGIYDLNGNLTNTIRDIPSIDGALVSNDGKYMLYTFGGIGLATANNPFATIEREGWALMRLADQKVVYSEYTDDGKLAFDGIVIVNNLLHIGYSTPDTRLDFDLLIFFNYENETIFKGKLTRADFIEIGEEMNKQQIKDWHPFLTNKYFQQIPITK